MVVRIFLFEQGTERLPLNVKCFDEIGFYLSADDLDGDIYHQEADDFWLAERLRGTLTCSQVTQVISMGMAEEESLFDQAT